MQKAALLFVVLLLAILAGHSYAATEVPSQQKTKGKLINNPNKDINQKAIRAAHLAEAQAPVHLYDVWFDFITDQDGDGYYQKFNVSFDLDTSAQQQDIYVIAELGDNQQPLFKTDDYSLYGNSANDSYQTTVLLTEGYPSNQYPLTLKVYDAHTEELLGVFSSHSSMLFEDLFLEDAEQDNIAAQHLEMYSLSYQLSEDWDGDSFFTQITISFDVDAPNQTRWVYAELFLIDPQGNWNTLSTTEDFRVNHYDSQDSFETTLTLNHGYEPQGYQVAVRIYDSNTHAQLLTSFSPSGSDAHMESTDWDSDNEDGYHEVIVEEEYYYASGSGGSFSWLMIPAALFMLRRKFHSV